MDDTHYPFGTDSGVSGAFNLAEISRGKDGKFKSGLGIGWIPLIITVVILSSSLSFPMYDMYWYVLICTDMYWYVLICIDMYWYVNSVLTKGEMFLSSTKWPYLLYYLTRYMWKRNEEINKKKSTVRIMTNE